MSHGERQARSQAGFTYIGLLVAIVLIGLMLAAAGEAARTTAQREREAELLFIGHQYRNAIARFYRQNHRYPQALEELLNFASGGPQAAHYLRRLYLDPMTRTPDWVLLQAPGSGINGVASSSQQVPMKRSGFDFVDAGFEDAQTYGDWTFVYDPRALINNPARPAVPR